MPKGYLLLILHAHLPYVHHPEYERFLEERWLFEAITDTYIPLIKFFDRLRGDRVAFKLTVSLSPTLATMLESPGLRERYVRHLELSQRLADQEIARTRSAPAIQTLARMYQTVLEEARETFVARSDGRLIQVFRDYEREGCLELMTCAGTHGFLPAFASEPETLRAQTFSAVHEHERLFGRKPRGMWLPECGFFPGVDKVLAEAGVRYSVLESHGIEHASPRPLFGVSAPVYCPSGVAMFGRHPATSKLVWSSMVGYPAHPDYREYYRDIGFDLDQEYLEPFQYAAGVRTSTGFKYYRSTGKGPHKELYNPDTARETAASHARDFLSRCRDQVHRSCPRMPFPPVLVSPYDAELFGHWWFEGPQWIHFLLREMSQTPEDLALTTPSDYLAEHPVHQKAVPSPSSWGRNGYHEHWLNPKTEWLWRPLHDAFLRMTSLLKSSPCWPRGSLEDRAARQAARELLLAQASDWPFAIADGTTDQYARRRLLDHLARFHDIVDDIENDRVDPERLAALEYMDAILPDLDYRLFEPSRAAGPSPSAAAQA